MTSDFVNAFIQKQKTLIAELQNKVLFVETQLELTQAAHNKLLEDYNSLKEEHEKQQKPKKSSIIDNP